MASSVQLGPAEVLLRDVVAQLTSEELKKVEFHMERWCSGSASWSELNTHFPYTHTYAYAAYAYTYYISLHI